MNNSKRSKHSAFAARVAGRLTICAMLAFGVSCAKPKIMLECPFGPRNADAAAEELAGALDDAPANYTWIGNAEHVCGFTRE